MAGADRLRGCHRHVDLGEAFAFETCGEGDQLGVVPDRQGGDGGGVDATGQERPDGDVGAHVFGHRVLQDGGDLVVAGLFGPRPERHGRESRLEVPVRPGRFSGPDDRVAAGLQPSHTAMQGFRLGNVLQHRVVLQGPGVDAEIQSQNAHQVEQTLLLAADGGAARSGRHEQRLDPEGVPGAEQLAARGVPQREGEHAAQPAQRRTAPVVVGGDDCLAVAVGGKNRTEFARQHLA